MTQKNGACAPTGSACLEKGCALLLALQPVGADLLLLIMLGALQWTA